MGNRAVITTVKEWQNDGIGVYLHWNGGRDSVEAFLTYCKMKGYREPDKDCYGWARLCQVIGNFFGGTTSVGIDKLWFLDKDNGDNGVYLLEGWDIAERFYHEGPEQQEYSMQEMLKAIDEAQPVKEQFGTEFWEAEETPTSELKVGDEVFVLSYGGEVSKEKIVGIGEDRVVNGTEVKGIPYIMKWMINNPAGNINNYLQDETYRRVRK